MCQGFSYFSTFLFIILSSHGRGFSYFLPFFTLFCMNQISQQQPKGELQKPANFSLQTSLNCFMACNIDQLSTLSHCLSITRCGMCVHRWFTLFVSRKRLP